MSVMPNENIIDVEIEKNNKEDLKAPVLKDIKYPIDDNYINTLLTEYKEIPVIDVNADDEIVSKQYQFVLNGHKAFVKARNTIEKTRKSLKQPALDYGRKVDSIAKEFQAKIKPFEDKLRLQREAVELNEERKQREAIEAENARIEAIQLKIKDFETYPMTFLNSSSNDLKIFLENDLQKPTKESFEEFYDEALEKYNTCVITLKKMVEDKILLEQAKEIQAKQEEEAQKLREEQEAKIRAEKEALEIQKMEFEKQKALFEQHQQAIQEEQKRLEAERLADELQAKQEVQRLEAERLAKENFEKNIAETLEAMNMYPDNKLLINAIIDNEIPHLQWSN